jgi:hypothetical protein
MITSNSKYLFGGKVATVETPSFKCCISTAKEGLFQKQTVWFSDFTKGWDNRERTAKLFYASVVTKNERLQWHDAITQALDIAGTSGATLQIALETLFASLDEKRIGWGEFVDEPYDLNKALHKLSKSK